MSGGNCMTCRFFEHDDGHGFDEGNCKRFPPTACFDAENDCCVTAWPLVVWTDWCGEYEKAQERQNDER